MASVATTTEHARDTRAVAVWLFVLAGLVLAMVTLGGLTRLTGSGLSITEWQPVRGVLPPLSEAGWADAFARYRHIPQFIRENSWMTLSDFRAIYWWEWTHRLLGRLLGLAFLIPFAWFAWTGAIARADFGRMLTLFALGGLQGVIGWWMVESGLETRIAVSQYRLAIHLGTAVLLLGALVWIGLQYLRTPSNPRGVARRSLWLFSCGFVVLVFIQMILGAFVAGLHAGLVYNTWPTMDGRAFPEGAFSAEPWWTNFFENPGLAQFDHRVGAYAVMLAAVALWYRMRNAGKNARRSSLALLHMTLVQAALGIVTLLMAAPLPLSALHQLFAAILFSAAVWNAFEARYAAIA